MAIVKTIKKGESLSFGFAFPDTYDITRLQNVKVYIGSSVYTHSMDGQKIRVVLRSNDTKLLTGTNVINLLVDDSIFGIRKVDYGSLQILPTQAVFSDESFNAGYDFLIPLIVTENTISVENVLYSVIEGKAATIEVGTVTTLAAGEDATVENVGDENEAVFNFGIPQGIQGERGLQGYTPYIGENGNWFINGIDTEVQAEGDATKQWVSDNYVEKQTGKSLIDDAKIAKLDAYPTLTGVATDGFVNAAGELEQIAAAVGGFANNLYFSPTNSNVAGYKTLTYDLPVAETVVSQAVLSSDGDLLVASHLFADAVAADIFPAGLWSFEFYGRVSSVAGAGSTQIGVRYFRYTSLGAKVYLFPAIVWSNAIVNTVNNWIPIVVQQPSFTVEAGDRMGCDIYVKTSAATSRTVYYTLGDGYASYLNNPNAVRHRILRAKNEELAYQHLDATTEKATPIDADSVGLWDSVTSIFKRITWANIKATLKTYFDTLYFKSVDVVGERSKSTTTVPSSKLVDDMSKLDISGSYENGGIYANGSVFGSTTIEKTGFIKLKAGDKIAYTGQRPEGLAAVNLYSSNNYSSFVSSLLLTGTNYTSHEITIPSDGFIVASSRKVGESGNTLKLQVVDNKFQGKFAVENRGLIHELESRANYIDDKITNVDITGSLVTGAIMSDGTINTGVTTSESTDYLSVREGDVFLYSGTTGSGTCNVAGYDLDKNFIEPILANANTAYNREAFTIPSGVFFIKASSRKVGQLSNIIKLKIENYDEYQLSENYKRVSDIHNRLLKIEEGSIYEYSNFIDGKIINTSGDIITLSTCEITEFIDVIEGAKFIYTSEIGTQVIPVAGYDENEQFVQPVVTGENKVFDNYEFTIPAGISKIVAMSRNASGSVSGTTLSISQIINSKNIKSELEALKDYVDLIGYKPAIVIEPVATDTVSSRFYRRFNVYSLVSNLNEYVKHEFVEVWNRTTNADRGWYCPNIKFRDETIAYGEFNWIHMLDSTVAGFESESGHVGITHGCEIFEREVFLLDGKEFTPGDPSFTTMHGDCFTMLSESTIYAGDRLSAANGDNNVFKLDANDNPIPSTKHWMHVKIEVNNKLYLRNKLKVLRDNTKFVQCHIGMLSCAPSYFQYEQIKNSNWDISYYPFLSTDTERQAGQAISPSTEVIGSGSLTKPLSNESVKWGENQGVNYQIKCNFKMLDPKYNGKENHIFMRTLSTNKTYMQPVLTTAFSVPDVFMGGDILEGEVFTEINIK